MKAFASITVLAALLALGDLAAVEEEPELLTVVQRACELLKVGEDLLELEAHLVEGLEARRRRVVVAEAVVVDAQRLACVLLCRHVIAAIVVERGETVEVFRHPEVVRPLGSSVGLEGQPSQPFGLLELAPPCQNQGETRTVAGDPPLARIVPRARRQDLPGAILRLREAASEAKHVAQGAEGLEELRVRQPEPSASVTLVHGDTKPGNFAFVGDDVSAVFDWEMTTVGDPLADLGGLRNRDISEPLGDLSHAFRRYQELSGEPLPHPWAVPLLATGLVGMGGVVALVIAFR